MAKSNLSKIKVKGINSLISKKKTKKKHPISFQIHDEKWQTWLEKRTDIDSKLIVIGLQFCFKDTSGNQLPEMIVRQVSVHPDSGELFAIDALDNKVKDDCKAYELQDASATTHLIKPANAVGSVDKFYKRFEFFPKTKSLDFVYFDLNTINHFRKYYQKLFISGCRIAFGRKPSSETPGAKHNDGPCFSLKLEGKSSTTSKKSQWEDEYESTVVEGVAVGAPCPPTWYIYDELTINLPPDIANKGTLVQQIRAAFPADLIFPAPPKASGNNTIHD